MKLSTEVHLNDQRADFVVHKQFDTLYSTYKAVVLASFASRTTPAWVHYF